MRKIKSVGVIAAVATVLLVAAPNVRLGQNLQEFETLNKKATEPFNAGKYEEAIPLVQRVLSMREKAVGPDHPDVAESLRILAGLHTRQGRYGDAEPLYQRSLAIFEEAHGPDHPNVATSLNNLAGLYTRQGRHAEAELLYKRSLPIVEKALGPDHP